MAYVVMIAKNQPRVFLRWLSYCDFLSASQCPKKASLGTDKITPNQMFNAKATNRTAGTLDDVPFSVFESIVAALKNVQTRQIAGLHQGKTTYRPCPDVRSWPKAAFELEHNVHAPPQGIRSLKEAIQSKHAKRGYGNFLMEQLMVCSGATHGLKIAAESVLSPGDETLARAKIAQDCLTVPHLGFSGGFYLFLDLTALGSAGLGPFHQALLEKGISLAPGQVFGTGMEKYARLCFTNALCQ